MWGMIVKTGLSWFFGGGLTKLGQLGIDAYKTKLSAENSTEVQVATLAGKAAELDSREAELDNRLLVAEQGNWATRWVRPMWAAPFVIWTWCKVVFEYTFHLMHVTELHDTASTMAVTIIVSYFGSRGLEKLVDKWAQVRLALTGKK